MGIRGPTNWFVCVLTVQLENFLFTGAGYFARSRPTINLNYLRRYKVKTKQLRTILKGTGAEIIEVDRTHVMVYRHSFRLAPITELSHFLTTSLPLLLDSRGREIPPTPSKYTSIVLESSFFDSIADIKIRYFRAKMLVFDTEDHNNRFRIRAAIFGEKPEWGPRKIWEERIIQKDILF